MELSQLEAFEAVAEEGSFTKAANVLCVTQPAVTRQIAALESELRTRLFDRMGRTVQLTSSGEMLRGYTSQILRLLREAKEAVAQVELGGMGRLSVGASSTSAAYILPTHLRRFRELFPDLELRVHTGTSSHIEEMVLAGSIDVGIVTGLRGRSGLVELHLGQYETVVVVYPDHPLAHRPKQGFVQIGEVAAYPLILMEEGTNLRTYVDGLLAEEREGVKVTMELDSVEAIKKMIEARLGISLLPRVSVEFEVQNSRLIALPLENIQKTERQIVAIYRHNKYLTPPTQTFLELLKA